MTQPHLRYSLQLSQGQTTNLTYVNAGQAATLTIVVSNPGAAVNITSFDFALGPFGNEATDLAENVSDITPIHSAEWRVVVSGSSFTLEPVGGGSFLVGTTPLTFAFDVQVSPSAGTSQLAITETSAQGTAHLAPLSITKMPSAFVLANLQATPAVVEPNGTVALNWNATPGQLYVVNYPGGTDTVAGLSGGSATWASPPVLSAYPTVTYTVSASIEVTGQVVSAAASASVVVDVPQIMSFEQPPTCYALPVVLHWATVNTDYCVVYADGVAIDSHAPANPGSGGYAAYPRAHHTQYQVQAYRGSNFVSSQTVDVTLYNWTLDHVLKWDDLQSLNTVLALTWDGGTLFYGGDFGVVAINTSTRALLWRVTLANGVHQQGLVLSRDGTKLFVASANGPLVAVDTTTAVVSAPISAVSGPMVSSADGATLYMVVVGGDPACSLVTVDVASTTVAKTAALPIGGGEPAIALSPSGSTLYVNMKDDYISAHLYAVDTGTLAAPRVYGTKPGPMALTGDGKTLYVGVTSRSVVLNVAGLVVPDVVVKSLAFLYDPSPHTSSFVLGMDSDPSHGVFVSVLQLTSDFHDFEMVLYFVNPVTNTASRVGSAHSSRARYAGVVVDAAGKYAYYADGVQVFQYNSLGGGARSVAPVTNDDDDEISGPS